jgi:hypothetical protein
MRRLNRWVAMWHLSCSTVCILAGTKLMILSTTLISRAYNHRKKAAAALGVNL